MLGLATIWLGGALGWGWVRNSTFRAIHLAAILIVALEALGGIACPLTVFEDILRGSSDEKSFMARWLGRLHYYDLPSWIFTVGYCTFAALVALTWRLVPPRPKRY